MEILDGAETLSKAIVGHITPAGEAGDKLVSVV
jgi:hypothetical protein